MKWTCLILAPLLIAGCGKVDRSIDAEIDADFAKGEVLLSCRSASSGTCHALFLIDGERLTAQAAVGASSGLNGVGEGADYCVEATPPDVTKCHPRPLVAGKQIVRKTTVTG